MPLKSPECLNIENVGNILIKSLHFPLIPIVYNIFLQKPGQIRSVIYQISYELTLQSMED